MNNKISSSLPIVPSRWLSTLAKRRSRTNQQQQQQRQQQWLSNILFKCKPVWILYFPSLTRAADGIHIRESVNGYTFWAFAFVNSNLSTIHLEQMFHLWSDVSCLAVVLFQNKTGLHTLRSLLRHRTSFLYLNSPQSPPTIIEKTRTRKTRKQQPAI